MSSDLHILQLEPYDDAISIRDRLSFINARFVLLVWPKQGAILHRKLDLLLVQRQATRLRLRLALVTSDPEVINNAEDLNISTFPSVNTARRGRWKRPRGKVFEERPDPIVDPIELAERVERIRGEIPLSPAALRRRLVLRWSMFGLLVAALLVGVMIAAPSATVTLTPDSRQVFERVSIIADPALTDIDIENRQMPAAVVALEASSHVTVELSGRESAGTSQAQGLVTFTNLTASPIVIPLGTIVATGDTYPVQFETLLETTLAAGPNSTAQVAIQAVADQSGTRGNVDPGTITRVEADFADQVSVTNANATYGGAVQERKFVTQADHDFLMNLGREEVIRHAEDLLLHQLTGEQFLVPGSVQIIAERPDWTNYSAPVGDASDSVSLDIRAQVQAVVVDGALARQVAYAGLSPQIQPGWEISPDDLTFSRGDIEVH